MTVQDKHTPPFDPEGVLQSDATTQASYHVYFTSGLYDQRYPAPNRTMWRRIRALVSPMSSVLDFGCGSGRYLLRLRGEVARAIGFDVSPAALDKLRARGAGWTELVVLGPEPDALDAHLAAEGPVDLVICLFGVLGHITNPAARAQALHQMHTCLKPGSGRLLISVPNRARRFRAEQAKSGSKGPIRYQRQIKEGGLVVLNYQLFDPAMLSAELTAAGFHLRHMGCESVLPESWLLHSAPLRWLDAVLTPLCPARWGYGIYAEASC